MILKLVIILQTWSTIHGATDPEKYIKKVQINATCRADKIKVTEYLQVEKWCFMMCKNKTTDWWEKTTEDFSDERLCNFDPFDPPIPVAVTGKCVNGSCRNPDSIARRTNQVPACFDYDRMLYNGEEIAEECKKSCYVNGSLKDVNLENGEKCVYKKTSYLFGLSEKVAEVGTCQDGRCIKKQECLRTKLPVYPGFSVDKECTITCNRSSRKQLDNGTMCVLRTSSSGFSFGSFFGTKPTTIVEEIGICDSGKCVKRDGYKVPTHNSTKGCNGTDVFINENLTVASHCQAECSDGTSEHRAMDILCLWLYRRHEHLDIFKIGFCYCGICEPRDNYVVLVDSKNPPVKDKDHLLESC
uniref:Putative salivary kunitz domain protein n=1 Tax=Ixodes ricinus TaxID=34613 RepID=A0A6B0V8F8_IXORI